MFSLYFILVLVRKLSIGKIVIKVKFVFLKVCFPVCLVGNTVNSQVLVAGKTFLFCNL